MSTTRKIAGNAAFQVLGKTLGTVFGLITVAIMTRHLGREGYGEFTTVLSFLQVFGILVDLGLTLTMVTMISRDGADESRIASNIFTLRLVSGLVFFGIAPLAAMPLPYPAAVKAGIAIGSLSFLGISLSSVLGGVFQKHLVTWKVAIAEIVGRGLLLAGVAYGASAGLGLVAFIWVLAASNVLQFAMTFAMTRKHVRISLRFDRDTWRDIIRESWPIGLSIAFNLVYLKGDVVVLSLMRSQEEVGLYGAAYKVLDVVTVVPMIFMGLVLPLLAAAWSRNDREGFSAKLGMAFDAMTILSIPLAVGAYAVGTDLMTFVAGDRFTEAGALLAVLMLGGAAVFFGALFGHAVVALGLQKKMILAYAADAVLAVILYLTLIPVYGAVAAAWVTFISEAFIAIVTAIAVFAVSKARISLRIATRVLVASAAMYWVLMLAEPLHVLIRIAFGTGVYALALFLIGGIPKGPFRLIFGGIYPKFRVMTR
jgi:O-antigen/teichoic acid export membrane protein